MSKKEFDFKELDILLHTELSAVVFVRDYLQFQFDGPTLTAYLWPTVRIGTRRLSADQDGYRDALCNLIGAEVSRIVSRIKHSIVFEFGGDPHLYFSLAEGDQVGPEALMLQSGDGANWGVW